MDDWGVVTDADTDSVFVEELFENDDGIWGKLDGFTFAGDLDDDEDGSAAIVCRQDIADGNDETFDDDEDDGDGELFDVPDPDDAGGRLDASDRVVERGWEVVVSVVFGI